MAATPNSRVVFLTGALAFTLLVIWHAADLRLASYMLLGSAATLLLLGGGAWLLMRLLGKLPQKMGPTWRFGFANVLRRGGTSSSQILAFGLGIMVLILLSMIRSDLQRGGIGANAPVNLLDFYADKLRELAEGRTWSPQTEVGQATQSAMERRFDWVSKLATIQSAPEAISLDALA